MYIPPRQNEHKTSARVWKGAGLLLTAPVWALLAPIADFLLIPVDYAEHRQITCPCMSACLDQWESVFGSQTH